MKTRRALTFLLVVFFLGIFAWLFLRLMTPTENDRILAATYKFEEKSSRLISEDPDFRIEKETNNGLYRLTFLNDINHIQLRWWNPATKEVSIIGDQEPYNDNPTESLEMYEYIERFKPEPDEKSAPTTGGS